MRMVSTLGAMALVLVILAAGVHASDFPATDVTIDNTTGMPVDGIAVYMSYATNFDPLVVNAPGCEWPEFEYSNWPYGTLKLNWPSACVDPGESVEFRFFSDCPSCEASFLGHSWLLHGIPAEDWEGIVWGDLNCSGTIDPLDALRVLIYDAGLPTTGGCIPMGQILPLESGIDVPWGDVDCTDGVTPVDALSILWFDAGVLYPAVIDDCPNPGDPFHTR
jgi:hypothetical protein